MKLPVILSLLLLTACAGYEYEAGRFTPVFDEPSHQTKFQLYVLWGDENSVYTSDGECHIRAVKSTDYDTVQARGESLWNCTQGVSTGKEFTLAEKWEAKAIPIRIHYTKDNPVLKQDITADMAWDEIAPSGYREAYGFSEPEGLRWAITAPRPVNGNDWLRLHTLGHELDHGVYPGFEDKKEYVKKDFSHLRR